MAGKLPFIDVGFHVFAEGGTEEFGAVRQVAPDGRPVLIVYFENRGDFEIPLDAVTGVAEEKVRVDARKLPIELRRAILHAHDEESR